MSGKRINYLHFLVLLSFAFFNRMEVKGQAPIQGQVPVYQVPYTMPTVENIKAALDRIKVYYEATSAQKVIDAETGRDITDFRN